MAPYQKPDNALRRANELLEVGRKQDALDTLHDVIRNRKVRQWTKVHEQIMFKHLELCVELRKPHLAKDGLFQYRNMCQMVNAKSLEDVIQKFLELSEKKAEQARQESHGLVEDVEDLDQAESPEKLLMSAVTGEGSQERADRTILSPWLRFLWEAYRQCLELLRNNMQVELLYHKVAKQAFNFCLKYQRKAEFRKLCDNLRTHLNQIQKAQHHAHYALKLTNAETLAMHQETRLVQLHIAIQMELWQEAFKSVEDVHQLMQLSKKQARSSALASYYEKLALIFWKADNYLYHAAVLLKLLHLTKELKKSVSAEELSNLATRVLLAVLSVNATGTCSDLSRHLEMEETFLENRRKLATLIMMPSPPTRQSLLKDIVRLNVCSVATSPAQTLYKLLETQFSPLNLATEVDKVLVVLSELGKPEQTKYIDRLKEVAASKILRQVAQIYSTATFKFLCKIIPYYDRSAVERLVVTMGKRYNFQVRLQHRTESVEFGLQEVHATDDASGTAAGSSSAVLSSNLNVPIIQTMPGEQIRQYLQQMYISLQDSCAFLDASETSLALSAALRQRIALYSFHKNDQHIAILNRKKQIEAFKETAERIKNDQEEIRKEQERRLNEQRQRDVEMRLQKEKKERMEQQKLREQEELKQRIMKDRLENMKDPKLRKIIEEMPGAELDHDTILAKQISHLEQEKREMVNKLKQQEKKWDYFVRAMYLEEIPLREQEYEKWAVEDVEQWENYETTRIEKAINDRKTFIETVERMKLVEDANEIMDQIRDSRAGDFQKHLQAWQKKLEEKRQERILERRKERKAKRREEWLEAKKEAERKKKEEEERQKREQEMGGRRGGFGDRYGRKPFDPQVDGGEPSGADADKWVRGQFPAREAGRLPRAFPQIAEGATAVDGEPIPVRRPQQSDNWRERTQPGQPPDATGPYRRGPFGPPPGQTETDGPYRNPAATGPDYERRGFDDYDRDRVPPLPRGPATGAPSEQQPQQRYVPPSGGGGGTYRPPSQRTPSSGLYRDREQAPPPSSAADRTMSWRQPAGTRDQPTSDTQPTSRGYPVRRSEDRSVDEPQKNGRPLTDAVPPTRGVSAPQGPPRPAPWSLGAPQTQPQQPSAADADDWRRQKPQPQPPPPNAWNKRLTAADTSGNWRKES